MNDKERRSSIRHKLNPIVIVLNNKGYGTERLLHAGEHEFNDVHSWQYHLLPEVLGGGTGYEVRTEGDFDRALRSAWDDRAGLSLIHVHLDPDDCSRTLRRLASKLGQRV